MPETIYTRGQSGEMPQIIDFINYVFSQAHVPHDFKQLLPKEYSDEASRGLEQQHFLAKQEGKIVACVACRPFTLVYGGRQLNCGFVGSVSVHPYHRGEGHMKRLMSDMLAGARQQGYDMLVLGGQRQRYNYFGFESAGFKLRCSVSQTNVRHALADVDAGDVQISPLTGEDVAFARELWYGAYQHSLRKEEGFLLDLRSWNTRPLLIRAGGERQGYLAGDELLLKDEAMLQKAIKALLAYTGDKSMSFSAPLFEKERIRGLTRLCEGAQLGAVEMINVLNWERTLKLFLEVKHEKVAPLEDGEIDLNIEGDGTFHISVKGGSVQVEKREGATEGVRLNHLEAIRAFFSLGGQLAGEAGLLASWQGLPFYMTTQDGF